MNKKKEDGPLKEVKKLKDILKRKTIQRQDFLVKFAEENFKDCLKRNFFKLVNQNGKNPKEILNIKKYNW